MLPPFSFGPGAGAVPPKRSRLSWNHHRSGALRRTMIRFRFITPHRAGKWYRDLETAQRHACAIGAGYFDERTRSFIAYCETRLEVATPEEPACRVA